MTVESGGVVEPGGRMESGDVLDSDGVTWTAPASEPELAELLGEAGTGSGRVRLPTGGGEPSGGEARAAGHREIRLPTLPGAGGVDVISLEAPSFARIVEYEPKDLTITVGAGARLDVLQDTLGAEGQWLPPAAWGAAGSVGGLVGAATPGPFDAAFGSVQRHVLAVRTVVWDGRSLTWGRAVVKNVAGYDMSGLWCGSRGRLGVVTQASLRVWPQPELREWLEVRGPADGWTLLESLGAVEPADDFRPDALLWQGARSGQGAYALVGLLGSEAAVRSRGALARSWAACHGYDVSERDVSEPRVGERGDETTSANPLAPPERRRRSLADITIRVHCPRTRLAAVGRRLTGALRDVPGALDALPDLGLLRVSRPEDTARAAALRDALFQAAGGARVTIEIGGPDELATAEAQREADVRSLEQAVLGALGGTARHWLADHV
jgi:FAD/FMN-containing dehydrogenase